MSERWIMQDACDRNLYYVFSDGHYMMEALDRLESAV